MCSPGKLPHLRYNMFNKRMCDFYSFTLMISVLFAALITLPMKWKLTISIMYIIKQPGETVSSGQCYYSLMSMVGVWKVAICIAK